jgi:hypothetical protein
MKPYPYMEINIGRDSIGVMENFIFSAVSIATVGSIGTLFLCYCKHENIVG